MSKDRVVVAMSGGVDSSVAAAFLNKKGYEVVGLTMRLWGENNRCCSTKDVEDARLVARHLSIPHYIVSLEESFKNSVVNYFVDEYIRGRTPNPCAVCNPEIKFGKLLNKALEIGARYLATGHYAIVSYDKSNDRYLLKRAKEKGKDQSYFLARLSQKSLSRILFPVGTFPKEKIRKLAEQFKLPVASKVESQEVCFVPDGNIAEFVEKHSHNPIPVGSFKNSEGQTLGHHRGITGYTIGQRKGLGISAGKPIYVTNIDATTNTITIGSPEELYNYRFIASHSHWIYNPAEHTSIRTKVRIRYKHRPEWAEVRPLPDRKVEVIFDKAQRAITPGQLAVFYDNDIVLGSAWIEQVVT
jgi:tRNA-specific 2-thiouridylase